MFTIRFSERCAWRAVYLYRAASDGSQRQLAFLSVDPTTDFGPRFSGRVGPFSWRMPLPRVPWRSNAGPIYRWAATLSSRFWHRLDGRYSASRRRA